jgi:hypothetical protein
LADAQQNYQGCFMHLLALEQELGYAHIRADVLKVSNQLAKAGMEHIWGQVGFLNSLKLSIDVL